jgi:hypothetical protein
MLNGEVLPKSGVNIIKTTDYFIIFNYRASLSMDRRSRSVHTLSSLGEGEEA